jgi:hypothetical protein
MLLTLVVVGPIFAINVAVDPYQILHDFRPTPLTPARPDLHEDRITLPYKMLREPAQVLIVGSSRARYVLNDGTQTSVAKSDSRPFFGKLQVETVAISGANIHVMRRAVEHGLHVDHVQQVVLLIDDVAMNHYRPDGDGWKDARFQGGTPSESRIEMFGNFLNSAMLKASFTAVAQSRTNATAAPSPPPTEDQLLQQWRHDLAEFYRTDLYGCYQVTSQEKSELDRLLRDLRSAGVTTYILTPAIHATLFEQIWRTGSWPQYGTFLRLLTEEGASNGVPVWHFSPYTPITNPWPPFVNRNTSDPDEYPWYSDPGHSNSAIGKVMMATVLGQPIPKDAAGFGVQLTPGDVDQEIQRLTGERQQYLANHPEMQQLLPPLQPPACPA